MLRLATSAVISFSSLPLRMATRLGLVFSALGLAYLVYILGAWLFLEGVVSGWTSTISVVLILGGVQLVATGLLGEYLAVVYEETKGRPLYIVKETQGGQAEKPPREEA
jgi:dolichol-phosphate mannosyltransferase